MIKNKNKIYKKGEFYGLYGLQSDDYCYENNKFYYNL